MNEHIIDFFYHNSNILFFSFFRDGQIREMNDYTQQLLNIENASSLNVSDIIIDFTGKQNFLHNINTEEQPILLSVNTKHDLPSSFHFYFKKSDDLYLAFGQMNPSEVEYTNKQFIKLNNELNVSTRKLHKQNAELNKLKKLKEQYLSIAAHDLRNPLGNIINFAELVNEKIKEGHTEQNQKFLDTIKQQANFGIELLNELLQISRLDSGNIRLKMNPGELNKIIEVAVYVNKINAKNKNIEIHFEKDPSIPKISFDYNAISQVLNNLISNAIKYSQSGTQILVKSQKEDNQVRVNVKDQGIGIPEKDRPALFEPFSTASTQPTSNESSTGLGLSIAKKIIEAHEGSIDFTSRPGQGSDFYFVLPLK